MIRWARLLALAGLVLTIAPVAAWWAAVRAGRYPVSRLARRQAASLTVLDAAGDVLRQDATSAGGRETWVALDRIAPALVSATLASEDRRFWRHSGVDPIGVIRAVGLDLARGRAAFGGSTLTMQLARLIDPHPRSLWGKAGEAIAAGRLERAVDKREILEQYLNRVYYGNRSWGVEAAARFYFGKPALSLSLGEAAFLAVLPRGPEAYDPFRHLPAALRRRTRILASMRADGAVTAAECDVAERTPLVFRRAHPELGAPHFVAHALGSLAAEDRAGAVIETTLDTPLQRRIEIAVRDHLDAVGGRAISQAGVVVLRNRDGAVLAMVGSRDYFDAEHAGAVNVTTILRRPGSTLKPFVYALALEAGDSPATMAYDLVLPGETRQGYTAEVKQHGPARYREALAGSYNLAAVHTLARVGVSRLVDRLRAAGLTTLNDASAAYGPSLAIGETEFRLLEYAGAFAAFGNEGRAVVPRAVNRVRFPDGTIIDAAARPGAALFSPEVAYLVFDMLSDPDARRPMFGSAAPTDVGFPIALKTGTTRGYTDDLAFGTTGEYTVGAWAGNFDGSPTANVMAMQGAAPLVRAAFVALAARYGQPSAPVQPAALERHTVCALSGLLPGPDCPAKRELFAPGTAPATTCTWHRRVDGEARIVWPPIAAGWARARHRSGIDAGTLTGTAGGERAGAGAAPAGLRIVYPANGARFLLDPERPATEQRPPLRASPPGAPVRWAIDGVPASLWTPTPGRHIIGATWGRESRQVEIEFQ